MMMILNFGLAPWKQKRSKRLKLRRSQIMIILQARLLSAVGYPARQI